MGVPLRIIRGTLSHIANSDALYVGLIQEVQHHAETLRAHTDKCQIDLVAGRNVSRPAQNTARNDGETDRRGCALDNEFASRKGLTGRLRLIFHCGLLSELGPVNETGVFLMRNAARQNSSGIVLLSGK